MGARTVTVSLNANVGGFVAGMGQAAASADQLASKLERGQQSTRDGWDRVGNTLLGVGAAAAVGVGAVVKTFADFDQAMSGVAATGQDARQNLDGLRETAIKVGADTAFSAREAAGGMEELLKAGVSAADVMGGGLKGAMDLAAAGTLEVGEASEIAATAMTQFKLSGKDVPHIADLLAAGAGKAQGSVQDMGMALKQSGLVASQFGLSIEETTGTLAAFASSGLIGSDAGTSFKTMLLSLANPSKESADLMRELGINAYDAGGKFVGIASLAEQLQTKLGGLTQAQRDQALAQIFGNDAVRAANVLFQQGGKGIQDWIGKVNEAGYAAETAAVKQGNLRGDFEKLTGSIESLFLKAGSGGNDFLRGVVQGAEKAVDALGKLPNWASQGMLALTALAGGGALVAGGLMKGVGAVTDTIGAWRSLQSESPKVAGALTGLGKAAGIAMGAMVALAAVNWAGSAYQEGVEKTKLSLEGMANAAGAAASGSFGILNREFAQVGTTVHGMGDAFRVASTNQDTFRRGAQGVISSMVGVKGDILNAETSIKKLDQSLAGMDLTKAQSAFAAIAAENQKFGVSTEQTAALLPQFKAKLEQTAGALGVHNLSAQEYAEWMGGRVPAAVAAASAAQQASGKATKEQAEAMSQVARSAREAANELLKFANANLQLSGSQMGVEAAIDAATASLKENGKTLDIGTEKGRANKQALDNIAASALKLAQSQAEAGRSSAEIGSAMDRNREAFIRAGEAMGMSRDAASRLADSYGLVGSKVAGLAKDAQAAGQGVQQGTQQAAGAMAALTNQLNTIPPIKAITVRGEGIPETSAALGDIRGKLDLMPPDKRITVTLPGGEVVNSTVADLKAKIDALPPEKRIPMAAPGAPEAAGQVDMIRNALMQTPDSKSIQMQAPGAPWVSGSISQIWFALQQVPDEKVVNVTLPNGQNVTATAGQVKESIRQIPDNKDVSVTASTNAPAVAGVAQGAMNSTHGVNRQIDVGTNAPATAGTAQGAMDRTRGVNRDINVSTNAGSTASAAQSLMDGVRSVTRYITTIMRTIVEGGGMGPGTAHGGLGIPVAATPAHYGPGVLFRANGGPTPATGPSRVDKFPAWLAAREFVQPEVATDYYGMGVMEAMRRRRIPKEAFSPYGFADGGSPTSRHIRLPEQTVSVPPTINPDAIAVAVSGAIAEMRPVVNIGGREFYGVMQTLQRRHGGGR